MEGVSKAVVVHRLTWSLHGSGIPLAALPLVFIGVSILSSSAITAGFLASSQLAASNQPRSKITCVRLAKMQGSSPFASTLSHDSLKPHSSLSSTFSSDNAAREGSDVPDGANCIQTDEGQSSNNKQDAFSMANETNGIGRLEQLKQREAELSGLLSHIRQEKLSILRDRPLTIGVVGFGRFGQFMARSFSRHHSVVVSSRSDYTDVARGMGVTYVPFSNVNEFLGKQLDVIVLAVSIVSFEDTVRTLGPHLQAYVKCHSGGHKFAISRRGPLIVDVLSVKEHPRKILLDYLPKECDILCTHPMFGPDSGKNGWHDLNFVYEKTRIGGVVLNSTYPATTNSDTGRKQKIPSSDIFVEVTGVDHNVHEGSDVHVEGMDRVERFLSIWEEAGCRMVPLSCREHDEYAANSQFVTHLMGRILGAQGLQPTPIDTKGFESVLKLIGTTTADSFDLFFGLYKYNQNSMDTILKLRGAMDDVVENLKMMERNEPVKAGKALLRKESQK